MEIKKTEAADLENKKSTSYLIGFVLVFALLFAAFEFTTYEKAEVIDTGLADIVIEEEVIPVTEQKQEMAPPPPSAPTVSDVLNIGDNSSVEESDIQTNEDLGEAVIPVVQKPVEAPKVQEEEVEDQSVFQVVEKMPEFPGGMAACLKFLSNNIKYPTISQENGVQGKVIVQFVVNKDGSIVDPVVVRSVDPYLDKEALRVISMMPKWSPGMQRGKPVRVKYTVPVTFRLQ